jgi:hypothetical protein
MGVEDQFCSVHWRSLVESRSQIGQSVLDGDCSKFLQGVPVTAKSQMYKYWIGEYTDLWEFMLAWKDFDSAACQAFGRFVEAVSHTFQSGRCLKSDLEVSNINSTCVFAPTRVRQIWEAALSLVEAEDLKSCVDAVWGLALSFRYGLGKFPEFKTRFCEMKAVWQDAVQRENGIVIARW